MQADGGADGGIRKDQNELQGRSLEEHGVPTIGTNDGTQNEIGVAEDIGGTRKWFTYFTTKQFYVVLALG